MTKLPSREWVARFADAAEAYRVAFRNVQHLLRNAQLGRIPAWCFAVDRMDIEDLEKLSPELAAAEQERRRRRVALHAVSELFALSGERDPSMPDPSASEKLLGTLDGDGDAELDRFITVVNYAKAGGVIYINGTFEPVAGGRPTPGAAQGGDGNAPDAD